jgi:two-component system, OmpR family, phosphate regulon sensor histidine kinase PhoR
VRPAVLLLAIATISAVPLVALAVLVLTGLATAGPAIAAMAVILVAASGIALAWHHDVTGIAEALRQAANDDPAIAPPGSSPSLLIPAAPITEEMERLSRALARRAALVGQLRRADEAIVEKLPDPLIVLGADRSVRRTNSAARATFGADIGLVLRHPELRAAIDRALAQGVSQSAELSLPVPVAREVHATVMSLDQPLADGGKVMAVLSDRTRDRAVERMRADFVANASHELRTPLASLIGFIETLRGPAADDPPAQARFLGIMAEQAARMSRLIDDLLSLSRIELTEHQPPPDRVDLEALLPRVAAGLEPHTAARRITLQIAVDPALPQVAGDADQLAQVLQNLLDNAVKYGREGGKVQLAAKSVSGGRWPARPGVLLSVTDDGPGIPREHIPRLTERFYRVDKGRSRAVGGTGLGLAIVKHIVHRHRGQLAIDSTEGAGACFSVWLPAALSEPLTGAAARTRTA